MEWSTPPTYTTVGSWDWSEQKGAGQRKFRFSGSTWVRAAAVLLGLIAVDESSCVAGCAARVRMHIDGTITFLGPYDDRAR